MIALIQYCLDFSHAYILGLVGPRMVRLDHMESQEMRISPEQNRSDNGSFYGPVTNGRSNLGSIFAKFYGVKPYFPIYQEIKVKLILLTL